MSFEPLRNEKRWTWGRVPLGVESAEAWHLPAAVFDKLYARQYNPKGTFLHYPSRDDALSDLANTEVSNAFHALRRNQV